MKQWLKLTVFVAALSVTSATLAQSVDEQIGELKKQISALEEQQIELKKEATAAAAALPNFSYRSGGGLTVEAADKAWGINFGVEGHMRMNFESGRDQAGRTNGEIMGRRFRMQNSYCVNNCFYEIFLRYDNDGFGTNSALQRGIMQVHLEQINPWLPMVSFGMDGPMPLSLYRQGSGNTGAQSEYDLLSRNNGLNTGRYGNGFTLNWDDISFSTGRAQFNVGMATFAEGDDGASSNSDRKDFALYARIEPFTKIKNKWIQGLGFETNHWFCNNDPRNTAAVNGNDGGNVSGCRRLRIQDHGDGGRQTLFQFAPTGGRGLQDWHFFGMGWRVGPYWLRAIRGMQNFDFGSNAQGVDATGRNFLIAHDLFVWSPKGWFTGDSTTPGSILVGTHFERNDVSCGRSNCATGGEFSRNRILLREWDLWYFLPNRISIGGSVLWYDASNLRSGRTEAQENIGCSGAGRSTRGKNCDWLTGNLNFRFSF